MPPRTRKTAAPAPSLEDAAATAEQAETPDTGAETEPEPTEPTVPAVPAEPEVDAAGTEDEHAAAEPEEPAAGPVQPAVAAVETFHWESVKNDGSEPCRLCTPGGPPPGAGSFGCSHGQWVRVPDVV